MLTVSAAAAKDVSNAYPTLVDGFLPEFKCARNGPDLPALAWLLDVIDETDRQYEIAVAVDGNDVGGLVVVHLADLRIAWLCVNNDYPGGFAAVYTPLCEYVQATYGIAWGIIENPEVVAFIQGADTNVAAAKTTTQWGTVDATKVDAAVLDKLAKIPELKQIGEVAMAVETAVEVP